MSNMKFYVFLEEFSLLLSPYELLYYYGFSLLIEKYDGF